MIKRTHFWKGSCLTNLTYLALIMCGVSHAQGAPANPDVLSAPETVPVDLLKALVGVINTQDPGQINLFVRQNFAIEKFPADSMASVSISYEQVSRTLLNLGRRSGGLIIEGNPPGGPGATAILRAKKTGRPLFLTIETTNGPSLQIDGYQVILPPPPIEEYVPKVPVGATILERLKTARQGFDKACSQDLFSGALEIKRHGTIVFQGACGERDKSSGRLNTVNTPFAIASVGKLFTAVAVAQLVSEGRLNYDLPIITYLPDYPDKQAASAITLRQLLKHTSGLGDYLSKKPLASVARKLKDYYPLFANDSLLFEPGKGNSYSNSGFLVASMIVEQVSGEPFGRYLRRHVFGPAGMTSTSWSKPRGTARPYIKDNADDPLASDSAWISPTGFYKGLPAGPAAGPGGEYSTVGDLQRFATALRDGRLLSVKEFDAMVRDGLGCQCSSEPLHRIYAHPGGGPGIDAGLKLYVDQGFTVAVLSNYDAPFPRILANALGDLLLEP